jgi:ssDNA-binding Zn-finger/Zn-ribbon topoisomerase 1
MKAVILENFEEFEDKFRQEYEVINDVPEGNPRCDSCQNMTFEYTPEEDENIKDIYEERAIEVGKCIKASNIASNTLGSPYTMITDMKTYCKLYETKKELSNAEIEALR